jgi:hypothetical protein
MATGSKKAPAKAGARKAGARKTGGKAAPAGSAPDIPDMPFAGVQDIDIAQAAVAEFSSGRDSLLDGAVPPTLLPDSEEAFYARDPFSADYADFLKGKADIRWAKEAAVDQEMRADLLARPHLMERPEESTHRGAAAVWRSLKDQLKNESLTILDRSDPEELLMLQRELQARKLVVDSVAKGVEGLLKRVEQRLGELSRSTDGGKPKAKG